MPPKRKPDAEKKRNVINVRFDDALHEAIRTSATENGRSLSGEIQWRLEAYERQANSFRLLVGTNDHARRHLQGMATALLACENYEDPDSTPASRRHKYSREERDAGFLLAAQYYFSAAIGKVYPDGAPDILDGFAMCGRAAFATERPLKERVDELRAQMAGRRQELAEYEDVTQGDNYWHHKQFLERDLELIERELAQIELDAASVVNSEKRKGKSQ